MVLWKNFLVTEANERRPDVEHTLSSDDGRIYITVGPLAVCIKQSDDGQGIIIDCTDSETYTQDMHSATIWYDDVKTLDDE